jgi:hypothetical protein
MPTRVEAMMVGVTVTVAIVFFIFFCAGIVFGVAWIYVRSLRRERNRLGPGDHGAGDEDPEPRKWPFLD